MAAWGFEIVPNGPKRTRFRAVFGFSPVPETSPKGPKKGLNRPGRGHQEVAKGRPEVLERSQDGSGKVIRRTKKIGSEEPLGTPPGSGELSACFDKALCLGMPEDAWGYLPGSGELSALFDKALCTKK